MRRLRRCVAKGCQRGQCARNRGRARRWTTAAHHESHGGHARGCSSTRSARLPPITTSGMTSAPRYDWHILRRCCRPLRRIGSSSSRPRTFCRVCLAAPPCRALRRARGRRAREPHVHVCVASRARVGAQVCEGVVFLQIRRGYAYAWRSGTWCPHVTVAAPG